MPKLTATANSIFQIIATIAQLGNQYSDVIPAEYKGLATGILAILQGIVAVRAHFVTPQGTSIQPKA